MKKRTYLFLALLLPALVFVFLKYFGSNRFDIPIYYTDSVSVAGPCAVVKAPYVLPDSVWSLFPGHKAANVAALAGLDDEVRKEISEEIGAAVDIVLLDGMDSARLSRWRNCVFLAGPTRPSVLFDGKGRIRGYYDLKSREESDRLRVELKILLDQY